MVIVSRISKGSLMDQIYIPKNRNGLEVGSYVIIEPLEKAEAIKKESFKANFYNSSSIEKIKLYIIEKIFNIVNNASKVENVIITGSFLDKGFNFNDIDVLIISNKEPDIGHLNRKLNEEIGIKCHILVTENKSLIRGLETDPFYQLLLSKCVSQKKLIYKIKNNPNYKILDLHLLKSRALIDNFKILNGNEKYKLIRNLMAIKIFLDNKKLINENIEKEIENSLQINSQDLKNNIIDEKVFITRYKNLYNKISKKILERIKNDSEQK